MEALLDELDRKGDKAAFFCTEEFPDAGRGLLRRMMATGQAVGLAVDASDPERSVTEQLLAANELLYQATCTKSRLAVLENEKSQARQQAEEAGFCCLRQIWTGRPMNSKAPLGRTAFCGGSPAGAV